jgi:hypothetical protein
VISKNHYYRDDNNVQIFNIRKYLLTNKFNITIISLGKLILMEDGNKIGNKGVKVLSKCSLLFLE